MIALITMHEHSALSHLLLSGLAPALLVFAVAGVRSLR